MVEALQSPKSSLDEVRRSTPGRSSGPVYFRAIQILRGLAAVSVVLYHVNFYAGGIGLSPNTVFRHFGPEFAHIGVFFFFVVSGFLMASLVANGTRLFLPRRLLRIYPTYWLAAILTILGRRVFLETPFNWKAMGLMALLPVGDSPQGRPYPLGVEWTLVYEIFFYMVCAVFANRWFRRALPVFLVLWLTVIGFASVYYRGHQFTTPSFAEIWFSPLDIPFIVGGIGYYFYRRLPALKGMWMLPCLVVAAPLFVVAELGVNYRGLARLAVNRGMDPVYPSLAIYAFAFLLILVPWLAAERNRPKSGRPSVLEKIGDYSYALYLIHVPVVTTIYLLTVPYHLNPNARVVLVFISAMTAGVLLGIVDVHIHEGFKRLLGRKRVGRAAVPGGG